MPNQYIVDYLKKNKDRLPFEVLKQKLLKVGYPDNQIEEAARLVYGVIPSPKKIPKAPTFWDFWHKKVYTSGKEKVFDFLLGFVFAIILNYILGFGLRFFGFYSVFFINFLIFLAIIIYFLIKRKYIAFGIICNVLFSFFRILDYIF